MTVGYLCANFSLPRPPCSRLRPNVRDRQTDVRHASSLNAPTLGGGSIITIIQDLMDICLVGCGEIWMYAISAGGSNLESYMAVASSESFAQFACRHC